MRLSQTGRFPIVLLLTGCASVGTPYPRWAEVGRQWGCDPLAVQSAYMEYAKTHDMDTVVPQVGWTACELLSRSGGPEDVDQVQVGGTRSANLFYRDLISRGTNGKRHLVTLVQGSDGWRVSSVVW